MRLSFIQPPVLCKHADAAPVLIAFGLATMLAATCWSAGPVVTGMSLVALGATIATIAQLREAASLRSAVVVHLFVYSSLYLLFVGAVCDAAMRGPQDGLTFLQGLDFGISAGVMLLVVRFSFAAINRCGDTSAR